MDHLMHTIYQPLDLMDSIAAMNSVGRGLRRQYLDRAAGIAELYQEIGVLQRDHTVGPSADAFEDLAVDNQGAATRPKGSISFHINFVIDQGCLGFLRYA